MIYAMSDIHGCIADLLKQMEDWLNEDRGRKTRTNVLKSIDEAPKEWYTTSCVPFTFYRCF